MKCFPFGYLRYNMKRQLSNRGEAPIAVFIRQSIGTDFSAATNFFLNYVSGKPDNVHHEILTLSPD